MGDLQTHINRILRELRRASAPGAPLGVGAPGGPYVRNVPGPVAPPPTF